ncbi:hypothetical protein JXA02_04280 [candidate division KSB1 bacterium]|nr:hypothetical protein [candidate division KSB1 bacterium]RQW08944.1 MAG: hypothetical protein EH222_04820 [candidate division KSB1 bacterium]
MNCKTARKLLHLTPDEISIGDWQALRAHLAACETCRDEQRLFEVQRSALNEIRLEPHLDHPTELTNDILRSVRAAGFCRVRAKPVDKLLDLFARRPVRLAFAACVTLMIGLFIAQEIIILRRFARLEGRLAQTASSTQFATSPQDVLSLLGQEGERVVIDKKLLEEFLLSYGDLQMKNRLLLQALEEQAQRSNITWQDGLTEEELRSLLKNKTVQQKLKEL